MFATLALPNFLRRILRWQQKKTGSVLGFFLPPLSWCKMVKNKRGIETIAKAGKGVWFPPRNNIAITKVCDDNDGDDNDDDDNDGDDYDGDDNDGDDNDGDDDDGDDDHEDGKEEMDNN